MIQELLMKPGRFDLRLKKSCPERIKQMFRQVGYNQFGAYSLICVTHTRIADRTLSYSGVIANSAYTGVFRRTDWSTLTISGASPLILLGNEQLAGPTVTAPAYPATFTAFLTAALPANGITLGVGHSTTATTYNTAFPTSSSFRSNLDLFAKATGNEYQVTASGALNYGAIGAGGLFAVNPTVLLAWGTSGRNVRLTGLRTTKLTMTEDTESILSGVNAYGPAGASGGYAGVPEAYPLKFDATGTASMARSIQIASNNGTDQVNAAQGEWNLYSTIKRAISCTIDEYAPTRFITPGDNVYVHNQDANLYDPSGTNVTRFRGQTLYPWLARVYGITWPVDLPSMGVYGLFPTGVGGSPTWNSVDLTDHIEPESGDTSLDLGAYPRPLGPVFARDPSTIF